MQTSGYHTGLSLPLICVVSKRNFKSVFINRDNITTHRVWKLCRGIWAFIYCWEGACDHGSGMLASCKSSTKRIIPILHNVCILPDIRLERKSIFVLSEPKTILHKHKVVGVFAKFSYIYTASYRNEIALHAERQMYVVLFQTLPRATHRF